MFDSFCKSLRRPSGGFQVMSQTVHRLMVGTVDHGTRPQKPLQQASRLTADRVVDIFLSLVAHPPSGLQVLDQRASQKHVEHLHPRQIPSTGRFQVRKASAKASSARSRSRSGGLEPRFSCPNRTGSISPPPHNTRASQLGSGMGQIPGTGIAPARSTARI